MYNLKLFRYTVFEISACMNKYMDRRIDRLSGTQYSLYYFSGVDNNNWPIVHFEKFMVQLFSFFFFFVNLLVPCHNHYYPTTRFK